MKNSYGNFLIIVGIVCLFLWIVSRRDCTAHADTISSTTPGWHEVHNTTPNTGSVVEKAIAAQGQYVTTWPTGELKGRTVEHFDAKGLRSVPEPGYTPLMLSGLAALAFLALWRREQT